MHSEISNEGYKNGKREGLWESYYRNGQLHTKGQYRKGKREGEWEFYYRNGQLECKDITKMETRTDYSNSIMPKANSILTARAPIKMGKKSALRF